MGWDEQRSVERAQAGYDDTDGLTIKRVTKALDFEGKLQRLQQAHERAAAGSAWHDTPLVFTSKVGTPLDASHVRRDVRIALRGARGIDPQEWTPRELRHSFVSLLSDQGVPIEEISRLVGHSSTAVTELVYRHQIRPVLQGGAVVMDRIFKT
jgi:integrase